MGELVTRSKDVLDIVSAMQLVVVRRRELAGISAHTGGGVARAGMKVVLPDAQGEQRTSRRKVRPYWASSPTT